MRPVVPLLLLAACQAPDMRSAFNQVDVHVEATPQDAANRFADAIDSAAQRVQVSIPTDQEGVVADALISAWNKGRDVEVITDIDQMDAPGIAMLLDADVPVTLADGGLEYFDFNVNDPVRFESEDTILSDTWAVVDNQRVLVGTDVGSAGSGESVFFELVGEELVEDFQSEHLQIYGGVDATSTTAFDALAKSIADKRWRYATDSDLDLEVWFGPQQRLIKRLVDAIYTARGSVHLMTNDLGDAGIARALEAKASWGFTVEALVGPEYDRSTHRPAQVFQNETPNVPKRRFTQADDLPTVLIVDWDAGLDGKQYDTRIFVLSHDVYTTSRIDAAEPPPPFTEEPYIGPVTDQLIDGTLLVLTDYDDANKEMTELYDLFRRHYDNAGAL